MAVTQTEDNPQSLLSRAQSGDMDAFCGLVLQLESRLTGQALALCGDLATAEDLAQQTWIEAWKSLARFDGSCRFTTWLYGILLHLHYRVLRQKRSRPIALASLPIEESEKMHEGLMDAPDADPSPVDALLIKELGDQWRGLLESLPELHRNVVLLRYFEDASLEEIASVTGCSVNTVKTRLHHALNKLRRLKETVNFPKAGRDT